MTEWDWDTSVDPERMLRFLLGRAVSARKLRLFLGARCRSFRQVPHEERLRRTLEAAERYADGRAGPEELQSALWAAQQKVPATNLWAIEVEGLGVNQRKSRLCWHHLGWAALPDDQLPEAARVCVIAGSFYVGREVLPLLVGALRDAFANPVRPVSLDTAWRTPTVLQLAEAAYAGRALPGGLLDAGRLAVLADALEEAGCDGRELLGHLRGPGPHVRGCWALDRVLGKE